MSLLAQILGTVASNPQSPSELARSLGSSENALAGMLRTLQNSGYLQEALPQTDGCACGPCALKSMCRNADTQGSEQAASPLHLLKLTPRGEVYLARQITLVRSTV